MTTKGTKRIKKKNLHMDVNLPKITNSDYNKMQAKTQRKEEYVCINWSI